MADDTEPVNEGKWCFAWFAAKPPTTRTEKAALVTGSKWQSTNPTISISFLDGTDAQKALVRRFAVEWITNLAKLNFSWQDPPNTDIRNLISIQRLVVRNRHHAKNIPKNQPTMNFGWLTPDVTDEEARRVILHEYSHTLSLIHEHQNPLSTIN